MTIVPHAVAAALGLLLAHRERRFRFMSRAIVALLTVDAGQFAARAMRGDVSARLAAIAAGAAVAPYEGVARASWAVEQALTVAWYGVLAWAVWRGLKDESPAGETTGLSAPPTGPAARRTAPLLPLYLVTAFLASSVLLFALYPLVRGRPVELAAVVVFCAALAAQLVAATRYVLAWRRPDAARGVALVLVAGSVADAVVWMGARPARDWSAAGPVGVLIWLVVGGVELCSIVKMRGR